MKRPYSVAAIAAAAHLAIIPLRANSQNAVKINSGDIGGVVTGPHGPEAGFG